jgi:hypothetical protein
MLVLLIEGIFFFKYAVEIASCGMMYIPSFMNTGTGSGAMIYMPRFMKIGAGMSKFLRGYIYRHTAR